LNKFVHNNLGAQILNAQIKGVDLFYLSPLHNLNSKTSIRGGVPILFPQFGEIGKYKKHGFVRDLNWRLINEVNNFSKYSVEYECIIEENSDYLWENRAKLNLFANCYENLFIIKLQIKNIGNNKFNFTGGLHPYFRISSRRAIRIMGLERCQFRDTYPEIEEVFDLNNDTLIERLYLDNKKITFFNGLYNFTLKSNGFENWMIWNPGKIGAELISDLPNGDWDKFLCIEPIIKETPYLLNPNQEFTGELLIEINN
jgi:glucose-6-phosphate 1-epimerase